MLSIHFLNVSQGDSIIVHHSGPKGDHFGLIDSNCPEPGNPPALEKLKALGAEQLSFIALTHPHADHYTGLSAIIEEYKNKIDKFYSFPLGHLTQDRLREFAELYKKLLSSTPDIKIRKTAIELVRTLSYVNKYIGEKNWEEPNGLFNRITPEGFEELEIYVLLPPAKVKGNYFSMIQNGSLEKLSRKKENDLSLAFLIKYNGYEIILGGDCTTDNWDYHKKSCDKGNIEICGNIIKLPHHGAKKECSPQIINHLRGSEHPIIACISSNGNKHHPHYKTLSTLYENKIHPYCSNLSENCGTILEQFLEDDKLSPELNRLLESIFEGCSTQKAQPCQGDITVTIEDSGKMSVERQFNHPCLYRGEMQYLGV